MCSPNQKVLCGTEECLTCFRRSFASHPKSSFWSDKNIIPPIQACMGSHQKYWFNCDCGHEFYSNISNISSKNRWCPYCSSPPKLLCSKEDCQSCFNKSFASHEKSVHWSDKNELTPRQVFKNSSTYKVWLNCDCDHVFSITPANIGISQWCPYCSSSPKALCNDETCKSCFEKSFASHEKSVFWSDKNELTPRFIFKNANKGIFFDCNNCNHTFSTTLSNITSKNTWCPYCSNPPKMLCDNEQCQQCFEKSFASHEKSSFWSTRNDITPRQIFKGSSTDKYWFNCECGHEFDIILSSVTSNNQWCSYCCNPPQKLCGDNDCQQCFEKSFASQEKSIFWSDQNKLLPREVLKFSSAVKIWFNCDCGHQFDSYPLSISCGGHWCPYCTNQKLCDDENCQSCFTKSFASHEKSIFWSDRNKLKPREVFRFSSAEKIWFNCDCGHEFDSIPNRISQGGWCPYCCVPSKSLCDDEKCQQCFEKSFASNERSAYWSEKNELSPRQIFKCTGKFYFFKCEQGHLFQAAISSIFGGSWCPKCKLKTERKLFEKLVLHFPNLIHQYRVDWCKNNETKRYLPFDFAEKDLKIIIELDGAQHFRQVANWSSPDIQHKNDLYKMECANKNNFSVIRIIQEDVWNDLYDWVEEIRKTIDKIKVENFVQNIFLCKKNEYDIF